MRSTHSFWRVLGGMRDDRGCLRHRRGVRSRDIHARPGYFSTVVAGYQSFASSEYSTALGGVYLQAPGYGATAVGGYGTTATGAYETVVQ